MRDSGEDLDALWGFPQIMRKVKIRQMVVFISLKCSLMGRWLKLLPPELKHS